MLGKSPTHPLHHSTAELEARRLRLQGRGLSQVPPGDIRSVGIPVNMGQQFLCQSQCILVIKLQAATVATTT